MQNLHQHPRIDLSESKNTSVLSASNITMQFGAKPLFENISVKFGGGNRYGLIGANGCGKSTFMKILGGLENVDEQLNFPAWAKRIVVNTLIDEYRKKKNYNSKVTAKETERELDQYGAQASNDGEASFAYENLLKLIAQLPEISGKVFNLYVIEGYNHKEIGDLLGFSEGTSKWHLSTARKALREKLEKIENWNSRMVV